MAKPQGLCGAPESCEWEEPSFIDITRTTAVALRLCLNHTALAGRKGGRGAGDRGQGGQMFPPTVSGCFLLVFFSPLSSLRCDLDRKLFANCSTLSGLLLWPRLQTSHKQLSFFGQVFCVGHTLQTFPRFGKPVWLGLLFLQPVRKLCVGYLFIFWSTWPLANFSEHQTFYFEWIVQWSQSMGREIFVCVFVLIWQEKKTNFGSFRQAVFSFAFNICFKPTWRSL